MPCVVPGAIYVAPRSNSGDLRGLSIKLLPILFIATSQRTRDLSKIGCEASHIHFCPPLYLSFVVYFEAVVEDKLSNVCVSNVKN